ncbi:MAG: hypothetical protein E7579_07780 [Ruminococcaceae bacterium]|nr:hypothetical protein [Oscillospiraceae bacterium]
MFIKIDFTKNLGAIKPLHGVGQPPFTGGRGYSMLHYLTEAGIPFSRLHDVGGAYGGGRFVDIPNLFRNFDADPEDPASYDFTFTDLLITALMDAKVEPFFRLGVTIENDAVVKSYRIDPPKDPAKWAVICEKVIRHYTEGWADGFHYNIRYWEIWNEPENHVDPKRNEMWTGTAEDYYELYNVTAKHLKKCFPHLNIGGYASCGFYAITTDKPSAREQYFVDFFDGFLKSVKENGSPLDFFSWHSYASIPATMKFADYAREQLDKYGFTDAETTCNEWNPEVNLRGTGRHAALTTGMMLAMQNSPLDSAMFYDARYGTSIYGSLFNPLTAEPFPAYYGFLAFNELYKRGTQAEVVCDDQMVYALAAYNGTDGYLVIANTGADSVPLKIEANGKVIGCQLLDGEHLLEACEQPDAIPANSVLALRIQIEA